MSTELESYQAYINNSRDLKLLSLKRFLQNNNPYKLKLTIT